MRGYHVRSGPNSTTTNDPAFPAATWRPPVTWSRKKRLPSPSRWPTWCLSRYDTILGPGPRLSRTRASMCSGAKGDVYVITGPVFDSSSPRIGTNGVNVPSHVFKLVYDSETRQAWAHWQRNRDDEVASRPISYSGVGADVRVSSGCRSGRQSPDFESSARACFDARAQCPKIWLRPLRGSRAII